MLRNESFRVGGWVLKEMQGKLTLEFYSRNPDVTNPNYGSFETLHVCTPSGVTPNDLQDLRYLLERIK